MTTSLAAPRLIASDIDGTLLDANHRVTKRNRETIARAVASGAIFALSTGRPYRWIRPVLDQLPVRPICVTSNGAVIFDSFQDRVVQSYELKPEVLHDVVTLAQGALSSSGGVSVGAERVGNTPQDPVNELFVVDPSYSDNAVFDGFGVLTLEDVVARPASKLLLRNPHLSSAEMFEAVGPLIDPDVAHITYSMDDGILEVASAGVTKAHGVQWLAQHHGIDRAETIAFGDMPNDIEMLRWVGWGYAMANAAPAVKEAADEIALSNRESGVGRVLENWF
ncbi:HAD family hydrolase [Corynebacterium flavescens]|uniref:HAD family hydrolase n=1 Tax=Corynebacterium flavescens TaxID=28028 RepID=UPI00257B2AB2|nr:MULTISPECIES: HAD family hydrolase [Corynebacterium]